MNYKGIISELEFPEGTIFDAEENLLFSDHVDGREDPLSSLYEFTEEDSRAKVISYPQFNQGLLIFYR